MSLLQTITCTLLALCAASAGASPTIPTVWRCAGNSYSSQPCSNGRPLDTMAAPSAEAQRQAHEVAERDRRLAREMAQERREREHTLRQTLGSGLTGFGSGVMPASTAALSRQGVQRQRQPKKQSVKQAVKRSERAPSGLGKTAAAVSSSGAGV